MTLQSPNEAVRLELVGPHVVLVTINRPDARNAVNGQVAQGIGQAVEQTERMAEVWATIITGAGDKAFCAGADLKEVSNGRLKSLFTAEGGFGGFVHARRSKPWIAAVNATAVAGGFEIALACEFIVAADNAKFGLPEVSRGLIAAAGGLYRLPRVLPRQLANEVIASGKPLEARRCFELGIINRMVAPEQVLPEAVQFAAEICANAPLAVQESLKVARSCFDMTDAQLRALSDQAQERIMLTEDFKEGPRAFVEKRTPRWMGR
jgi:enoyl-CoA hydratase/carnithine racemase